MPRVLFEKTGNAVWISHLDLMRVFQRAFKRGGIEIGYSQGYSPRAYVSIALPLSVGAESICEILDFDLDPCCSVPISEIPERLNRTLPDGVRVMSVWENGRKMRELTHLSVRIHLEYDKGIPENASQEITAMFSAGKPVLMDKKTKSGSIATINITEMIQSLSVCTADSNMLEISAVICAQNPSLNPMMIPEAIGKYLPAYKPDFARSKRIEALDSSGTPFR